MTRLTLALSQSEARLLIWAINAAKKAATENANREILGALCGTLSRWLEAIEQEREK